jgi:hypothetical protein
VLAGILQGLEAAEIRRPLDLRRVPTDHFRLNLCWNRGASRYEVALEELRELAHGIYPPLLADRGLPEALSAVLAARASAVGVRTRSAAAAIFRDSQLAAERRRLKNSIETELEADRASRPLSGLQASAVLVVDGTSCGKVRAPDQMRTTGRRYLARSLRSAASYNSTSVLAVHGFVVVGGRDTRARPELWGPLISPPRPLDPPQHPDRVLAITGLDTSARSGRPVDPRLRRRPVYPPCSATTSSRVAARPRTHRYGC